jgi:DNA-binding beta-propeller fold protein YncE
MLAPDCGRDMLVNNINDAIAITERRRRDMNTRTHKRALLIGVAMLVITAASTRLKADTGACGGASITLPFTDVPSSNIFFCSIAEAYFSALTNGTSATTFSPSANVPREQTAAFVTRALEQALKRGSERAVLGQSWNTQGARNLGLTDVGGQPLLIKSDGADLWVGDVDLGTVSRVRGSDGKLLETWTGAASGFGVLCAMGKVFVTGSTSPGRLYQIDPTQPPGAVTTLSSNLGGGTSGITFDGQRIWTANFNVPNSGSISIVSLNPTTVTNITTGFSHPIGILYDGTNVWVTDSGDNTLKKLDTSGGILESIPVGMSPFFPAFDGANLWVPNLNSNSVSVVRAAGPLGGKVVATLSGNGLSGPLAAAFDGERILITNIDVGSVSLWKALDLIPLGSFFTVQAGFPYGTCSDGVNFWITLNSTGKVARF